MTGLLTLIGASIAVVVLAVGVGSIFAYFKEIAKKASLNSAAYVKTVSVEL